MSKFTKTCICLTWNNGNKDISSYKIIHKRAKTTTTFCLAQKSCEWLRSEAPIVHVKCHNLIFKDSTGVKVMDSMGDSRGVKLKKSGGTTFTYTTLPQRMCCLANGMVCLIPEEVYPVGSTLARENKNIQRLHYNWQLCIWLGSTLRLLEKMKTFRKIKLNWSGLCGSAWTHSESERKM